MEDKDDDNAFECLKVNLEFKICWGLACLTTFDAILTCFSIYCYSNFHSHLLRYSTLIPHNEESNLSILSPKSLYRDKTVNYMKFVDVCIGKT